MEAADPCRISQSSQSKDRIVVVGDLHGCFDGLLRVLRIAGLVDAQNHWSGRRGDHLVICGDMVDEGASSRDILCLVRSLQSEAGGQVTVLMGNHELLLLRSLEDSSMSPAWETTWSWAEAYPCLGSFLSRHAVPRLTTERIRLSFQETFISSGRAEYPLDYTTVCAAIPKSVAREAAGLLHSALDRDGSLEWLRRLPVACRIGEWGFFHGGPPSEFPGGISELNRQFAELLTASHWESPLLDPYSSSASPVSTRRWMAGGEGAVNALLTTFGVERVGFGHSPGALNGIFGRLDQRWGKVFKADTYFSLGVEGFLEIFEESVWAVYTPEGRNVFRRIHPNEPPLPESELLWSA